MLNRTALTATQLKAVTTLVVSGIPELEMSGDDAKYWLDNRADELHQGMRQLLCRSTKPAGNWLDAIIARQKEVVGDLANPDDIDFFAATLEDPRFGQEKVVAWQRLKLEPLCFPRTIFDDEFLANRPPFSQFYRDQVAAGSIKRMMDGQLVPVENVGLDGIIALVDIRIKPEYKDGRQQFKEGDKLLGPIVRQLRSNGSIPLHTPATSRYNISSDEWRDYVQPELSGRQEFAGVSWELESYPLFWLLGQTLRPGDGNTSTGVWFEEYFKDDSYRLHGGYSGHGGLADCYWYYSCNHWYYRGFRPLGVLDTLPLVP